VKTVYGKSDRRLPLRAANLSETTELENDFCDHQWNSPVRPPAYVIQSIHTDSLTHKRYVGDDSITYDPGPRKKWDARLFEKFHMNAVGGLSNLQEGLG
jgi:hypothetical protein